MKNFFNYLRNVKGELTHVVWPSRNQAIAHTILILILSALTAAFLAFLDYAFTGVIGRLITGQ